MWWLWNIYALCDEYEMYVHYVIDYDIYGCYENKWRKETSVPAMLMNKDWWSLCDTLSLVL